MAADVSTEDIKKLRDMTGAGMMDCKKALAEFKNDFALAADALRAKGLAKAAKRMDRDTAQGRVIAYIHGDGGIGVLVQLNCETDFVAKNADFEALGRDICMQIAASSPLCVSADQLDPAEIERESAVYREQLKDQGKPADQIEKILPGKIKKFQSEVCLMDQAFIKEPKITVQDHIKEHISKFGENITVARFSRYQVG